MTQKTKTSRTRPKIKYRPTWGGPIAGFTVNAIRKVFPMMANQYEFEDLLQEAQIKFLACCRAYSGKVDNPAWFMSLYKRALVNHLTTLAERNSRYNFLDYNDPALLPDVLDASLNGSELIEVMQVMTNLPTEFAEVLTSLVTGQKKHVSKRRVRELRERLGQELKLPLV